jgi:hypothetical protein
MHTLPAVLPIHVPAGRVCIRRTTGRCCRNSDSDGGGTWKLTHLRILGLSKKRGQSERDTVADMHWSAYQRPRITFGRETPNSVTQSTYNKYKEERWFIPRVAAQRWVAGRWRVDAVQEDPQRPRRRLGSPSTSLRSSSYNKGTKG